MKHLLFIVLLIVGLAISANAQVELVPGVKSGDEKMMHYNKIIEFEEIDSLQFRLFTYTNDQKQVKGVMIRSFSLYERGEKGLFDNLERLKTFYTEKIGPPRWNRLSQWNVPYALKEKQVIRVTSWVTEELIVFIGVYGNDEFSNKIMVEVYDVNMLEL